MDYALHRRGEIYPGELAQYFWYDIKDNHPDFDTYVPGRGEIYNLKLLKDVINVFDRRKFQIRTPMSQGEANQTVGLINEFLAKVKYHDINIKHNRGYLGEIKSLVNLYREEGKTGHLLLAVDGMMMILHHDKNALEKFLGTDYDGGRYRTVSGVVAKEALDLQRGGRGEPGPGEGQHLIDIWIEDLERRRLT